MGNVGQHYYTWRYTTPAASSPQPPAPAPQAADTWVRVEGSHLTYGGGPVRLKGTNYWRSDQPFVGTWINWKAPLMQQELAAAAAMGVNTIRIGIPYDQPDALDVIWGGGCDENGRNCSAIRGPVVDRMTQLLQIAAGYQMKVIFTLFEWNNSFPAPDESGYERQMAYLRGIVAPFKDDDRVIAWDLHNEPENYASWNDGPAGPARVIAWVDRVAAETRRLDPRHLLTVGVGHYENLWLAPQGRSLLDIVDFASFHCYSAGTLRTQMDAIHAHTQKPVLLEEMGWPTGPEILNRWPNVYDDPTQQFLYRTMLGDAQAGDLAGVVQWTLYDNPRGNTERTRKPTVESFFGLVRLDGSWKPAAADFRDRYQTVLLPSAPHAEVPLTAP
jgi:endo-1,4-beta-mannosidase